MATAEERQKILELVATGKISAQEAAALLNPTTVDATVETPPEKLAAMPPAPEPPAASTEMAAAETPANAEEPVAKEKAPPTAGPSWLRIRVNDTASGRNKVSVNIPLRVMKVGLQLGSSFAPELRNVDWEYLSTSLAEGEGGLLVEVQDEEDGEHVRIFVE